MTKTTTAESAAKPTPPFDVSERAPSVGELKDDDDTTLGTRVDDLLPDLSEERRRSRDAAGDHCHILLAVQHVRDGTLENSRPDVELPKDLSGLRVDSLQITTLGPVEHEATRRGHRAAEERQVFLDSPYGLLLHRVPRLELREESAAVRLVEIELRGEIELARIVGLVLAGDVHAEVERRDVDEARLVAVRHWLPVLAAEEIRAHVARPAIELRSLLGVFDRPPGRLVDGLRPVHVDER